MPPSQRQKRLSELEVVVMSSPPHLYWEQFDLILCRRKNNISAEEQLEWPSLPDLQPEVWVCPQGYLGRIRILWNSRTVHLPAEGNPRDVDSTLTTIYVQGDTLEERYLAICCLVLEGFPQFVLLGLTMVHWHSPFRCPALELFREVRDKNEMKIGFLRVWGDRVLRHPATS